MKSTGRRFHLKKHIAKLLATACVAPAMVLGFSIHALAGDINGEEARVIAAASGTFYYNNEAYAAKSEYISQLYGYLSRDDINLTAAQADAAISEMYGSIGQGVAEGYLYKIGGSDDPSSTTESGDTTEATTETTKPPIMIIPTEEPDPANTTETANTETSDNADSDIDGEPVPEGKTVETASTETVIDQVDEDKADGKVTYDVQHHTMVYENKDGSEVKELPSVEHPLDVTGYVNTGIIVILVMMAIILLAVLGLYLGKCFPRQKKKRNRKTAHYYVNHKMRSTYRKITGHTFTVLIACHIFAFALLLGVGASVFRQSFVVDNLTSSGYYRYVYSDMQQTIRRELAAQEQGAVDQLLDQVGYDAFLNVAKEQAIGSLSGEIKTYDGAALQEKLMTVDCGLKTDDKQMCANVIVGNVQAYSADMVCSSIYGIKQGYRDFIKHTIPIMLVNLLLMVVVVILMDRYHHRGVRYIARGVIAGAAIAMITAGVIYMVKPYRKIYIQPSSLYLFMREYIQHAAVIVAAIACIFVLAGAVLMALVGLIRKKQMEDD